MNELTAKAPDALIDGPEGFSREEVIAALTGSRNRALAEQFLITLVLAAETHPEEMRRALATVFDLSAFEATSKRTLAVAREAMKAAQEARELFKQLQHDLDQFEGRIDGLLFECERLEAARHPAIKIA